MILKPLPTADLKHIFDPTNALAVFRVTAESRKSIFLDIHEAGWWACIAVVDTDAGNQYVVIAACGGIHGGNLLGAARQWKAEGRCLDFLFRRTGEDSITFVEPSAIVLANGDTLEIRHVHVLPDYHTHWWAHKLAELPQGWMRV